MTRHPAEAALTKSALLDLAVGFFVLASCPKAVHVYSRIEKIDAHIILRGNLSS